MIKQKEAVFAAYQAGINNGLAAGSEPLFDHVASQVEAGIRAGEVDYSKDRNDEKTVKSYSRSVTSNWFKKDDRISGAKYVPATKRGPQVKDDMLRKLNTSLKSLKAQAPGTVDMNLIQRVEAAIEERKAQVASTKAASKVQSIDDAMNTLAELGIAVD